MARTPMPRPCVFNTFTPSNRHVYTEQPSKTRPSPLVADSIHVHPQQLVNTSLFAAPDCSSLIPDTFPPGNLKFLRSSHSGVTCHPYSRCRAPCFLLSGCTEARGRSQTQQGRLRRDGLWLLRLADADWPSTATGPSHQRCGCLDRTTTTLYRPPMED